MIHTADQLEAVLPRIAGRTQNVNRPNTEAAYAVLEAMTPKEQYAFDLAVNYRCPKMAQVIWNRAKARLDERP